MIALEVNRTQLGAAADSLERLSKATSDMWPTMDAIGAVLVSGTQRRFDAQTAPDGTPWIPSIRATLEHGMTLQEHGHLKTSLAWEAHRDSVEVGSNKVYARIQQLGGTIHAKTSKGLRFQVAGHWVTKPSVTLPARPYLGIDEQDIANINSIVLADLEAAQSGKPA